MTNDHSIPPGTPGTPGTPGAPDHDPLARGDAFMRLFLPVEQRVYGLILSMVGNWSDADDLMQQATSVMWRKFDEFDRAKAVGFAAWALAVARYEVMDWRKRRATAKVRFSDPTVEAVADQMVAVAEQADIRRDALRGCLAKLADGDRELIRLRYEPGVSTEQIAERVGRSSSAVYKALNRIHGLLLRCIRQSMAEGDR